MLPNPIDLFFNYTVEAVYYYLDLIRGDNPNAFTRCRKVSPSTLLFQMLIRLGRSQKGEVDALFKEAGMDISDKGFFAARSKFNPEAVHVMADEFIAQIYDNYDDSIQKWNDLVILAVDGCRITVPDTQENKEVFGVQPGVSENQPAMALTSSLHDCKNNLKLDVQIDRYDGSELDMAMKHVNYYSDNFHQIALFTFDRGYVSIRLIDLIINRGHYFLIRTTSTDYIKMFDQVGINECKTLELTFDTADSNFYREDRHFRNHLLSTTYKLRFAKVVIGQDKDGNDIVETLITNLPEELSSPEQLKELYWSRWNVETSYNRWKNRMKAEEFSGYRPVLIKQDIYADMWMYNLVALKIIEKNEKIKPRKRSKNGRYIIKDNFNQVIGTLKNTLMEYLMTPNIIRKQQLLKYMDKSIQSAITYVKDDQRVYKREKPVNKSKMSYRKTY